MDRLGACFVPALSIFLRIGFLVVTLFEYRSYRTIVFASQGNRESYCVKPVNCIGFYINISSQETARGILHRCGNAASFFIPRREKKGEAGKKKKEVQWKWSIFLTLSAPKEDLRWLFVSTRRDSVRFTGSDILFRNFYVFFCYLLVVYVISQRHSCYLSLQFVREKKNLSWTRQTFIFLVRDRINSSQILCNKYFIVSKQGCR